MEIRKPLLRFVFLLVLSSCSSEKHPPIVWEFTTGYPIVTVPVVAGQYALFGSDKLYCVNAVTGQPIWEFAPYGIIKAQPVVNNNKVYFQCGGLYCLDLVTGRVNWEFWTDSWGETRVAVSEEFICFAKDDRLYCLNSATGKKIWETKTYSPAVRPVISGGRVYVGGEGSIQCINVMTGNTLWKTPHNTEREILQYDADKEKLYVAYDTMIQSFSHTDGSVVWSFNKGAALFCMYNNALYVAAGTIYCIDTGKGAVQWENASKMFARSKPMVSDEQLFISGVHGRLYCIDMRTGEKRWDIKIPSGGKIENGYLYCGSTNSRAYCIKLPE